MDKTLVNTLLDNLKEALNKIERMDLSVDMILGDEDIQDLIDRRMQMAIEICIDIASHLAAGMQLPRREKASDIFILLSENSIISLDIADKMAGAVGLRNIIVHEYADLDYVLAYSDLNTKLEDLRIFAKEVSKFLIKAKLGS